MPIFIATKYRKVSPKMSPMFQLPLDIPNVTIVNVETTTQYAFTGVSRLFEGAFYP
jgi:hypothetical protein